MPAASAPPFAVTVEFLIEMSAESIPAYEPLPAAVSLQFVTVTLFC